jgi:hypothetical protein
VGSIPSARPETSSCRWTQINRFLPQALPAEFAAKRLVRRFVLVLVVVLVLESGHAE